MSFSKVGCVAFAVCCGLLWSVQARAQETRAEGIEARQKEKAAALEPYKPSQFETFLNRLEQSFASPPSGFYPDFSTVYPGGGLTPGVGYRQFYAHDAVWSVRGSYSIKNYRLIEAATRTPWHGGGRWMLGARAGWLDAPEIGYFGQGMIDERERTNFHLSQGYAALTASVRPTRWSVLQAEVAYDDYDTESGRGRLPSIDTIHTAATAPGLGSAPAFVRTEATAAIDWRTSPGYSRKGGFYRVTLANYADRQDTYSFERVDGEVIQHIPILRENWVVSLRGRVQTTVNDDDAVPYFLLPQLGSGSTLRGYQTGRFRDRHSILTSAEFRWIPSRTALDMAFFYDAGKVTRRRDDLDFSDLATDWGIGARIHAPTTNILRIEAARGSEGWRLVFATHAAF